MRIPGFNISVVLFALVIGLGSASFSSERKDALRQMGQLEESFRNDEHASTTVDTLHTLNDYLRRAYLRNPALKAAFYRWKAALVKIPSVNSLPDPMITYAYYIENVETRVGPQNWKVGIKQAFPWFGTLSKKGDAAFEKAQAAYQKYRQEMLRVSYAVKSAYYDYYLLHRETELTQDNIALLSLWENIILTGFKTGRKHQPDVLKVQIELDLLRNRLEELREQKAPLLARLKALLNASDGERFPAPSAPAIPLPELAPDSLVAYALEHNPNLEAIRHLIEKEKAEIALAKKSSYPNFSFSVNYIETGEALNPALAESGKDPWLVGVSVNLPLWFGKNKALRRSAAARYRQVQYQKEDFGNSLRTFLAQTVYEYENARRNITLYTTDLLPKAEQSLKASFAAYQAGATDFLTILDAQRQLLAFQLKLETARTVAAKKLAEVEMLTGKELNPLKGNF